MPPLPYNSEPLDVLRSRYPAALAHVFDAAGIRDRGLIRPGECAANVFDFEDGLRLIVSRERLDRGSVVLHVSASFRPDSPQADDFRRRLDAATPGDVRAVVRLAREWAATVPARFAELSGGGPDLELSGFSDKGIPHWHAPESP